MRQHGALGNAGRAARVLQEGDIVPGQRHRLEAVPAPGGEGRVEADRIRQLPGRHHLLDVAQHQVDHGALDGAEHLAHRRHHDMLDRRVRDHLLQRVREILDNDDGRRP